MRLIDAEWIPISERLPDVNEPLLITYHRHWDDTRRVNRAHRIDDNWWELDFGGICRQNEVLAWMPLPEEYKGEG